MLLLAALLVASPVSAVEHLIPEGSTFGGQDWLRDYDFMVATVLKDAFVPSVAARVIVEPSFQTEYAVGVTVDKEQYSIFTLAPAIHLWGYQLLHDMEDEQVRVVKEGQGVRDDDDIARLRTLLPTDWHDVKFKRCSIGIDAALGKRIVEIWHRVLAETRFAEADNPPWNKSGNSLENETVVLDGIQYHFASGDMAGYATSPRSGAPAELVFIADEMAAYCSTKKLSVLSDLSTKVGVLDSEMKNPNRE